MSPTFVSLVGLQPAAVAATLKGYLNVRVRKVSRVLLLSTLGAETGANLLVAWVKKTYKIPCDLLPISDTLLQDGERQPPAKVIQNWMSNNPNQQILFNAQPGFNTHVVSLARTLPEYTIFLHPMFGQIYIRQSKDGQDAWEEINTVNFGFKSLLSLYGIEFEQDGEKTDSLIHQLVEPNFLTHVTRGLKLGETSIWFDLAYENGGFLYVLKVVDGSREEMLQEMRDLSRINNELNELQPRIAVLTPHEYVLARARRDKFIAINSRSLQGRERLEEWMRQSVPPPGSQFEQSPQLIDIPSTTVSEPISVTGKGGNGPPLVVCLGNDASVTLVSLYTHKPRHAFLFYDINTPTVVKAAHRLIDQINQIPVGRVALLGTDILGRGIASTLASKLSNAREPLRVDITPGTKAQACELIRIPNAEIWEISGDTGRANRISDPSGKSLPLEVPDILTQAYCVGGELQDIGGNLREFEEQKDFLGLLTQFYSRYVRENECKSIRLTNLDCQGGSLRIFNDGQIEVKLNGKHQNGFFPRQFGGYPFEILVANAFKSAGADEVRHNVKWDWPQHSQLGGTMDEVDVLARFGTRFVAVSCKAGRNVSIVQARREIEAVIKSGLGRFGIPILVRPFVKDQGIIRRSLKSRNEAHVLDLRYLETPHKLRSILGQIFKLRRKR
ncbi:MAG TPA: hypothetical protein EYP19_08255 [Desulfobacterales bacterium]|nr:hypothetical protein [Desulfobacterales bacterium]